MNIYSIELNEEQIILIFRALRTYAKRNEQRNRNALRQVARLRPELQASKVRDSLLLAGGLTLADLPGTTGDLVAAIRHRENSIAHRTRANELGGGDYQAVTSTNGGIALWTL